MKTPTFTLVHGDCRTILRGMADNSVDSIVTDPPYELGFMGRAWDRSGIAYDVDGVWRQCLRVLKPGGYLLAFGGTRTYHRLACAIEDAGFEVRDRVRFECSMLTKYGPWVDSLTPEQYDVLMELLNDTGLGSEMAWLNGMGFPKSKNGGKAVDEEMDAERVVIGTRKITGGRTRNDLHAYGKTGLRQSEVNITRPATQEAQRWEGWGTALKPAHEPICVARKPLEGTVAQNLIRHGVGAMNVDGCRVGDEVRENMAARNKEGGAAYQMSVTGMPKGVAGKTAVGRWPANVITDGSPEVVEAFPSTGPSKANEVSDGRRTTFYKAGGFSTGGTSGSRTPSNSHNDAGGSAARFFYCAKAGHADREFGLEGLPKELTAAMQGNLDGSRRNGVDKPYIKPPKRANVHPTVKPHELMRYLVRLVTPGGGTCLDPFNGSGSTGVACMVEGVNYVGCELLANHIKISEARIRRAQVRAGRIQGLGLTAPPPPPGTTTPRRARPGFLG